MTLQVPRYAILGNSGSGKSTLAQKLAAEHDLATLDLDTVYWKADQPGVEEDTAVAVAKLDAFIAQHDRWVIEGCYESLISASLKYDPELIFLDPGLERCVANCNARPWEPHKYASSSAQNKQLAALLEWVTDYYVRSGIMSYAEHLALFSAYEGSKTHLTSLSLGCR